MIPIQTESAWRGTSDCRNSGIRAMVLFADLTEEDFKHIHSPVDNLFMGKMQALPEDGTVTLFAREDMGAMMDLKLETVSREVSTLVRDVVIEPLDKVGRHYRVLSLQGLCD